MKKRVCAAVLFLTGTAAAFAAPAWLPEFGLSAGAGGILGGHFTRYRLQADGNNMAINANQNINQFEYGIFAFFDATFATIGIIFQGGASRFNEPARDGFGDPVSLPNLSESGQGWEAVLGFSILGRFPFRLSDRFTVFPLLGMDYHISLMQRRTDEQGRVYSRDDGQEMYLGGAFSLSDWNAFFVRIGGGVEFDLTERFFLRGDLLYGIRLMTSYERKNLEFMEALSDDPSPTLGGLSSGPSVRFSVGWRLR